MYSGQRAGYNSAVKCITVKMAIQVARKRRLWIHHWIHISQSVENMINFCDKPFFAQRECDPFLTSETTWCIGGERVNSLRMNLNGRVFVYTWARVSTVGVSWNVCVLLVLSSYRHGGYSRFGYHENEMNMPKWAHTCTESTFLYGGCLCGSLTPSRPLILWGL